MGVLFEINTYFEKNNIEERIKYFKTNPEKLYVDIDDHESMKDVIANKNHKGRDKFNLKYSSTKFLIKYDGKDIVNFYSPGDDSGLWLDYLKIIEDYLRHNQAERTYGLEYYKMGFKNIDGNKLNFYVLLEPENEVEISEILPKKEFLLALIKNLKYFYIKMDEYKVFEKQVQLGKMDSSFQSELYNRIEQCDVYIEKL